MRFSEELRCPGGEKCAPSPSCSVPPDLVCVGPHWACIDPPSVEACRPSGAAVRCWCCVMFWTIRTRGRTLHAHALTHCTDHRNNPPSPLYTHHTPTLTPCSLEFSPPPLQAAHFENQRGEADSVHFINSRTIPRSQGLIVGVWWWAASQELPPWCTWGVFATPRASIHRQAEAFCDTCCSCSGFKKNEGSIGIFFLHEFHLLIKSKLNPHSFIHIIFFYVMSGRLFQLQDVPRSH